MPTLNFKITVPDGAAVTMLMVEDAMKNTEELDNLSDGKSPATISGKIVFTGATHILDIMMRAVGDPSLAITFNFTTTDTPPKSIYSVDQELIVLRGGRGVFLDTKAVFPS